MNVPSLVFLFMLVSFSATAAHMPEVVKAKNVFLEIYKDREQLAITTLPSSPFATGYKAFYNGSIDKSDLPKGQGWYWNQSNKKVEINLGKKDDKPVYKLYIKKLNQRSHRDSNEKAPRLKLWLFSIFDFDSNELRGTAIWCEKGIDANAGDDNPVEGPPAVLTNRKKLSLEDDFPPPSALCDFLPADEMALPTVIEPPSLPTENITGRKRLFDEQGNNALEIFAMAPLIEYGMNAGEDIHNFAYWVVGNELDNLLLYLQDQTLDLVKWSNFVNLARSHGISDDHAFIMARIVFRNALKMPTSSQNNDNVL